MVDMDAWRMDHRPQKKWDAKAYLGVGGRKSRSFQDHIWYYLDLHPRAVNSQNSNHSTHRPNLYLVNSSSSQTLPLPSLRLHLPSLPYSALASYVGPFLLCTALPSTCFSFLTDWPLPANLLPVFSAPLEQQSCLFLPLLGNVE